MVNYSFYTYKYAINKAQNGNSDSLETVFVSSKLKGHFEPSVILVFSTSH